MDLENIRDSTTVFNLLLIKRYILQIATNTLDIFYAFLNNPADF